MCDEEATYTERARSWLKEFEPTPEQIQDAYSKMQTALEKSPHQVNADTAECLELLLKAYGGVGESVDGPLATIVASKADQQGSVAGEAELALDFGNLYEVSDCPAVGLSPSEKRAAFEKLKAELGSGSKSSATIF